MCSFIVYVVVFVSIVKLIGACVLSAIVVFDTDGLGVVVVVGSVVDGVTEAGILSLSLFLVVLVLLHAVVVYFVVSVLEVVIVIVVVADDVVVNVVVVFFTLLVLYLF